MSGVFDKQTSDKYDVIVGDGEQSSASKTDMGMTAEEAGNLTAELERIVEIEKQVSQRRGKTVRGLRSLRLQKLKESVPSRRNWSVSGVRKKERIRLEHEEAERRRLELIKKQQAEQAAREKAEREERERREKRKRSSILQDAKGKWKSVNAVKRSSVSVRKELGSERRKSSSAGSLGSAMDQQISTNEEAVSSSFVSEYESPEIAAKRRKKTTAA